MLSTHTENVGSLENDTKTDTDDEIEIVEINQINKPVKQRKANVILNLGSGKNQVTCKGLIDTGNTITEETAIEEELHKQLQVGFQSTGGKPIGTANNTACSQYLWVFLLYFGIQLVVAYEVLLQLLFPR